MNRSRVFFFFFLFPHPWKSFVEKSNKHVFVIYLVLSTNRFIFLKETQKFWQSHIASGRFAVSNTGRVFGKLCWIYFLYQNQCLEENRGRESGKNFCTRGSILFMLYKTIAFIVWSKDWLFQWFIYDLGIFCLFPCWCDRRWITLGIYRCYMRVCPFKA